MSSAKFYKYMSWGLFALNLILISFLIVGHPPRRGTVNNGGAKQAMNLSDEQHEKFIEFAEKQKEQITQFNKDQEVLLKTYFSQVLNEAEAINSDSILNLIVQLEKNKIIATYQHFEDVKSTLHDDQQNKFKTFTTHVISTLLNKKRPPKQKG